MKRELITRNWQCILLNLLILLIFILGYGHFGDIMVDSFREAYIPTQIAEGQVLYKNIFNIYAPLSYLLNTFFCNIFGMHLKVFYFIGLFLTLGIFNFIFLISKKFLQKNYALGISVISIFVGVVSPNVFNYFFPYSYGILYGLFFIFTSIYFGIYKKYPLMYLFYSLAVCCKYEFFLILPLLVYVSGKNHILKNIIALIIPPLFTFIPLFIEGLRIQDLLFSLQFFFVMASSKTLYWFYSVTGLVFRIELLQIYLINFIKLFIPILFIYYYRNIFAYCLVIIYSYFFINQEFLIFAFPFILVLFIQQYFRLNKLQKCIIIVNLLISIKVFFALTIQSYGIYFIPFALINLMILIPKRYKLTVFIVLILCSFSLCIKNIQLLFQKNVRIETSRGVIYTNQEYGNSINDLIKYVEANIPDDETVLVYPEGLCVNFLLNRKSDNKFYSLIPLYVEAFGEDTIIKRLDIKKPQNVIISNYDTSLYYYSYFGQDYAGNIFEYVIKNYNQGKTIGKNLIFMPFTRTK